MSRTAFSGDVNTQNHTWTSGLPSLVIKIVFCRFPLDAVFASVTQLGCSHISVLHLLHHRCNWCTWLWSRTTRILPLVPVQATAREDVQLLTVAGSGSLCEPRISRKTIALFTCPTRECGWLLASATSSKDGKYSLSGHLRGACARSSQSFQSS